MRPVRPPLHNRAGRKGHLRRKGKPRRHPLYPGLRQTDFEPCGPHREKTPVPLPTRLEELLHSHCGLQLPVRALPELRDFAVPQGKARRCHSRGGCHARRRGGGGLRKRLQEHILHVHRAHDIHGIRPRLRKARTRKGPQERLRIKRLHDPRERAAHRPLPRRKQHRPQGRQRILQEGLLGKGRAGQEDHKAHEGAWSMGRMHHARHPRAQRLGR